MKLAVTCRWHCYHSSFLCFNAFKKTTLNQSWNDSFKSNNGSNSWTIETVEMKYLKRIDSFVSNGTEAFRRFGFLYWRMWYLSPGDSFPSPDHLLFVGGKCGSVGPFYVCRLISALCSGIIYHRRRGEVLRLTAAECFPESSLSVKDAIHCLRCFSLIYNASVMRLCFRKNWTSSCGDSSGFRVIPEWWTCSNHSNPIKLSKRFFSLCSGFDLLTSMSNQMLNLNKLSLTDSLLINPNRISPV